jgi:hypothetical protein
LGLETEIIYQSQTGLRRFPQSLKLCYSPIVIERPDPHGFLNEELGSFY